MKRKVTISIITFLTLEIFSQEKPQTPLEKDTILVTGVRADSKTPVSQKTVKKKEIDTTYQGEEIPILLDKTPSVTSQTDGGHPQGYTTFRLRGIDQTRINMTLNGLPLNEPEDQGVYTSNFPGFANNISSAQIQRGVGTSSNGVASYGGSINFESQNGLEKKTELITGYGSWNTRRINFTKSTGLSEKKIALFTNASAYQSDGYKDHSGGKGFSIFSSAGYYGNYNIIKFTGFTGHAKNDLAWLAVPIQNIWKNPRINKNSKYEKDDFIQSLAQLQYIRIISDYSKFTTSIFYNRLDGNWILDENVSGTGTDLLNYKLASNFYGIISNFNYNKNGVNIHLGANGNLYDRKHAMGRMPFNHILDYANVGKKKEYSSFFKIGYDLGKFTLFGDIQYRHSLFQYNGDVKLRDQKWIFLNPRTGLVFTENSYLNFYFSIGKSRREPTRTNMFGGDDNLKNFVRIKSEEVVDYELGMNFNNHGITIQSNFYYMRFNNEITLLGALGANGLPLMRNVHKSYRSGWELDLNYKILSWLRFVSNANFSHNRITDGGKIFQPLYTPEIIINSGMEFILNKIIINFNLKHNSKSYIDYENTRTTPAFVIYGMNMSYDYGRFSFLFQANNLTNAHYFTSGYVIDYTSYYFANATRNFYFTLKINFE